MVGGIEVEDVDNAGGESGGGPTDVWRQDLDGAPALPSPRRDLHRQRQQDHHHDRWAAPHTAHFSHRLWAPKPPRLGTEGTLVASERALLHLRGPLRVPDYWSWRQATSPAPHSAEGALQLSGTRSGAALAATDPTPATPATPPTPETKPTSETKPALPPTQPSSMGFEVTSNTNSEAVPSVAAAVAAARPCAAAELRHACHLAVPFPLSFCTLGEHPSGGLQVAGESDVDASVAPGLQAGDRLCMVGGCSVLNVEASEVKSLLELLAAGDKAALSSVRTPAHDAAACRITAAVRRRGAILRGDEFMVEFGDGPLGITMEDCLVGEVAGQAEEAGVIEGCLLLRVAGVKVYDDLEAITVIKSVKRPLQMWFSKPKLDEDAGLSDKERKAKKKMARKKELKDAKAKRQKEKELQKARKKALKKGVPLPPEVGEEKGAAVGVLFVRSSLY